MAVNLIRNALIQPRSNFDNPKKRWKRAFEGRADEQRPNRKGRKIMLIHRVSMFIVSAAFVVLASCGGGGSYGTSPPPPPAPNTAILSITAANAQDITVSVLEAVTSTVDIVDIVDVVGLPIASATNQRFAETLVADIIAETTACDTGEVTTTWNDADNNLAISTGDTFDILFDMCFIAEEELTLDGTSSLSNMVVTGDPFFQIVPWGLATTYGFDNLAATDSVDTVIIDGILDLVTSSDDNVVVDFSIATNSLTAQQSGIGETLSAYVLTQTVDLNALTQVISTSGIFTSTELGGSVTFETLEDFVVMGDDNPSSGELLISDSGSSILLTVLDNISVQLEIDLDLDGTIDATLVVPWATFDNV